METQQQKFHSLLKQFSNAFLITLASGEIHSRPMAIAHLDNNCQLWFYSSRDTAKTHEIEINTKVHIICQNDSSAYLSLSGNAWLIDDRAQIQMFWKEPYRVWFPNGPEDPNLILISVKPVRGEYWDNTGFNKIQYIYEAAKAYISGDTPHIKEGEIHGVVALADK